MSTVRMPSQLLRRISSLADSPPTDADLLARFVATRDNAAFAELVQRHGSTVLAVCRRVTGNRHDADDAFQSTFLVLARKADRVRPESGLGGWLYGVAIRAARAAVSRTARRQSRETVVAEVPEVPDQSAQAPDSEAIRAVLEAIAELSEAYRTAVVLCELQGRPRALAARELGIPQGTLSSRLNAARRILAARLRGRELAVLAAVAGSISCPIQAAEVRLKVATSALPSPIVEKLAEVVMQTTNVRRNICVVAVALIMVSLAVARVPVSQPEDAPPPRAAQAVKPSRLIIGVADQVRYLTPDGKEIGRLTAETIKKAGVELPTQTLACTIGSKNFGMAERPDFAPHGRVAPDGRIPLAMRKGLYLLSAEPSIVARPVLAVGKKTVLFDGQDVPGVMAWSPDSRYAIGQHAETASDYRHTLIDTQTGTAEPLALPREHCVLDWSPDGSWFLTLHIHPTFSLWRGLSALSLDAGWSSENSLCWLSRDGKSVKTLVKDPFLGTAAISPDGSRIACQNLAAHRVRSDDGQVREVMNGFEIVILDLETGTKSVVTEQYPENEKNGSDHAFGLRWSPDGTQLVYTTLHLQYGEVMMGSVQVQTCLTDGSGKKTVFQTKPGDKLDSYSLIDWR